MLPPSAVLGGLRGLSSARPTPLDAERVLEQARLAAEAMGYEPAEVYEPWPLVDLGQQMLLNIHLFVGNSGLAVAGAALLLRLLTWPWNRRALQRQCDRLELLPVYMDIAKALNMAQRRRGGLDGGGAKGAADAEAECRRLTLLLQDFTQETKFSPMQGMGYQFGILMPLYLVGYFCLRGIVAHPDAFRGFVVEPALWLDSLVLPDPYGLLPLVSALAVWANLEINSPGARPGQEENALYMRLVVRGAALTFAPVTTLLPSAILVFMATNATYTATLMWTYRRFFWKSPQVRSHWLVDVPKEAAKLKA